MHMRTPIKNLLHYMCMLDPHLVHSGSPQRMSRKGFRGSDEGHVAVLVEHVLDRAQLLDVPHGGGGAMGVDVVDLLVAPEALGLRQG